MPKMKKLNLDELKVQSFITSLNKDSKNGLRGGVPVPNTQFCGDTYGLTCVNGCSDNCFPTVGCGGSGGGTTRSLEDDTNP